MALPDMDGENERRQLYYSMHPMGGNIAQAFVQPATSLPKIDNARCISVIETTLTRKGNGRDDPIRIITQYWSLDGRLLAESDPTRSLEDDK